jgi:serine/threonine protein kinase
MTTQLPDPLGLVGRTIDKYVIAELAGEGGFSCVYKAEHQIWKEPVAIKFFNVLGEMRAELRERMLQDFIQEGKLMTKLSSRSAAIVQARDIGRYEPPGGGDWIPFMVLEWIAGTSLEAVLRDELERGLAPRDLRSSMALLEPAAVALDLAHRHNVAHRDLKPANFIVVGDARSDGALIKLLDFGIAKVMSEHQELHDQLKLTGHQVSAFTPNYGAPEQFSRTYGATGPWTDVFAMALVVIELLRGGYRALDGATFFELGVASCNAETRPTPHNLGIPVSHEVEQVFARAVALHPRDRFPTMGEFWAALHRAANPAASTWQPTRQAAAPTPPTVAFGPAPTQDSWPGAAMPSGLSLSAPMGPAGPTAVGLPVVMGAPLTTGSVMASARTENPTSSTLSNTATTSRHRSVGIVVGAAVVALTIGAVSMMILRSRTETSAEQDPLTPPVPAMSATPEPEPDPTPVIDPDPTETPATASAPSAASSPPTPAPLRPPPTKGSTKTPEPGVDPFDPSTFGGRK